MKKLLLAVIATITLNLVHSQKIDIILLTGYGATATFYYSTSDKTMISISADGKIEDFGPEYPKEFMGYYPGRLQQYMGRVEYYQATDNEAFSGKVRYIGATLITYYASYDNEALKGKVKSIGNMQFEYGTVYDNDALKGKIKNIGGMAVSWCASYENDAIVGKLKTVGNTRFDWYTSFDDKAVSGKVKQIDQYPFVYYTSFENYNGQKGQLKSGFYQKYINGINYYVRN